MVTSWNTPDSMTPNNLPITLTSFIGREREQADIFRLMATSHLVTLTGPGGCGKTRLALQVAEAAAGDFPDGVWLIDLASTHEPALVPQLAARVLGVATTSSQPVEETLGAWVATRRLLLLLDNCEHLIDACAGLAIALLSRGRELRILATSRERLAVSGEVVFPVAGLACPPIDVGATGRPFDPGEYDAARLLVERVKAVEPGFNLSPGGAAAMVEICRRLDGLPLALELAGAWANLLSLQQIAERLDDRFTLLASRQRGGSDPRHQTLRAALDWSHDLLALPEQVLLRRVSVFVTGFSLAAVEAVCSGVEVDGRLVLGLLSSLVEKSLVVACIADESEARYSLLETVRQYAQEKLALSGEEPAVRDRHLQYYLTLAEDTVPKLSGPYQKQWLNWLEGEYANIRAGLTWAVAGGHAAGWRIEAGLRIAIAIYQFWTIRDYAEEGLGWMERLLSQVDEQISALLRANALAYAAFLAGFRGRSSEQLGYGRAAADLAEAAGEEGKPALRWALYAQAYGARAVGDYQAEFSIGQQAIRLNRELADTHQLGLTLSTTSFSAIALGRYNEARAMLAEGLSLLRETGNPYRIAMALNFLGDLERCEQRYSKAQRAYEDSLTLLRTLDAPRDQASALQNLGHTCLHLGQIERAYSLFAESLSLQMTQSNTPGIAECLIGFAALAIRRGMPVESARLLAAAVAIGGLRVATAWAATRMEFDGCLAMTRAYLPEAEFLAQQAEGSRLSLEQAVMYAQGLPLQLPAEKELHAKPGELTRREREIAALIGRGMTNGEIAAGLVVSKRTVEKHVAHIMLKLGITHRAQIVRWAIESGLADT